MTSEDAKNRLLETVDQDTQDLIEWRLHSHTESSMRIIAGFEKQLKELTDIIKSHDRVLSSPNVDTLLKMIEEYQRLSTIHTSDMERANKVIYYGKIVTGVAAVIAALAYIGNYVSSHIKL